MHGQRGGFALVILASLNLVARSIGAQDVTTASFTHGLITFTQGTETFTWPQSTGMPASYVEFPTPDTGFQFFGFYHQAGCDSPACPTILVGVRMFVHDSGAVPPFVSIEVSGSPAGDVLFNGTPEQCHIAFTRHGVGGVSGTGDCTGVTFIKPGAPVGKFTFSAGP
jgi:hypothetical protein